ncbi:retropepsin-like aspartic protease family protein [Desulfotomaculum nigrificans]|uniref:retropepsin-like aspartic protease family protein n=1 Tax=Desulfotomaculum nigrificans TaxID=1565 RepID=UPI0001FAE9E1|nr:retropepsin-like aspartic protease [Desulfotomaculum nigrificans]
MNIMLKYGLPFTSVLLTHKGRSLHFDNFLVDTGSASTIIAAEIAVQLGLGPEPLDVIRRIRGVGGTEFVYEKHIDKIQMGSKKLDNLRIQIGDMDYGFDINGILGMDFLTRSKVIIDLETMTLI